jgi:hypothetical protein
MMLAKGESVQHTFDIDAIIFRASSLAVANDVLSIYPSHNPSRNMAGSLHSFSNINGKIVQTHRISHNLLGKFGPKECFRVYLMFPELYDEKACKQSIRSPTASLLQAFFDDLFFPSVQENVDPDIAQIWPYQVVGLLFVGAGSRDEAYLSR